MPELIPAEEKGIAAVPAMRWRRCFRIGERRFLWLGAEGQENAQIGWNNLRKMI